MHKRRLALFALLLFAFILRVENNGFLLPPVYEYPNELLKRDETLALAENQFDHGISMPSFLYNTLFLIYIPAKAFHQWGAAHWPGMFPFRLDLLAYLLWVGRVYMAILGTLTVWAVYLLGRRIGPARVGLWAAAILTVVPIHVLGSRHTKEDIPLGLFCTVLLVLLMDVIRRGLWKDKLRAAFATGLCLSVKWVAGVTIIPLIVANLMSPVRSGAANFKSRIKRFAILAGTILFGFYLASPDYLFRLSDFWKGIERGVKKSYDAHSDGMRVSVMDTAFTDYFRTGFWPGLTPVIVVLALIGMFWLVRRKKKMGALLVGWAILFYMLIESAAARPYPHYQRYLQPIIPLMALFAALGIDFIYRHLRQRFGHGAPRTLLRAGLLLICVAWPMRDSILYLRQIPDSTIIQCSEYINENIPAGTPILVDGYGPNLDNEKYKLSGYRKKSRLVVETFPTEPGYLLYSSMGLGRFLEQREANPVMTDFVLYVLANGTKVKEWRPQFKSFYAESPTLILLKFDHTDRPFIAPPQEDDEDD